MDEKFMKVLREQQEIQQKAARILHDTEKMKEEVQNKLESLKRKVENDFKNIGEFLKEANVQFATYESDGISTNKTNYRGKTILSIPYAGYISMYLQSTRGKIILVSVIVALFISGLILPKEKNQEEVKNE